MEAVLLIAILIVLVGISERLGAGENQADHEPSLAEAKRRWIDHYLHACSRCAVGRPACEAGDELYNSVARRR